MPKYPKIDNECVYIDAAYNFKDETRLEFSPIFKYCRYTNKYKCGGYIYNYDDEQTPIGRILSDCSEPIYDNNNNVISSNFGYVDAKKLVLNIDNPMCIEFLKHIYCDFNTSKNRYELKQEVYDYFEDDTDIININTLGDEIPISDLIPGNVYVIDYTFEHSSYYDDMKTINCGTFLGITEDGDYRFSYLFNPIDIPIGYAQDGSDSDSDTWGESNPLSYYYFIYYNAFYNDKPERISKKYINNTTWHEVKIYVELDAIMSIKRPTNEIVQAYTNLFKNTHHNSASLNALNNFVHPFDMVMSGLNAVEVNPAIDNVYELAEYLPKGGRKTKRLRATKAKQKTLSKRTKRQNK